MVDTFQLVGNSHLIRTGRYPCQKELMMFE
uniref:Uncharacterized protein n=1 Tax=Siphoviridae sp. ctGDt6 TaxID=2825408 RepID=A0A8S5U809_9CAUD|nr:MAG TPA: hypothetical protein [Siphoviridae sp. ctGDt6]